MEDLGDPLQFLGMKMDEVLFGGFLEGSEWEKPMVFFQLGRVSGETNTLNRSNMMRTFVVLGPKKAMENMTEVHQGLLDN